MEAKELVVDGHGHDQEGNTDNASGMDVEGDDRSGSLHSSYCENQKEEEDDGLQEPGHDDEGGSVSNERRND